MMLAEPTPHPDAAREKVVELMFETHGPPALYLARDAVLAAFATGRQTALVVDAGHDSTTGECLCGLGGCCVPLFASLFLPFPLALAPICSISLFLHATPSSFRGGPCVPRCASRAGTNQTKNTPHAQNTPPCFCSPLK